MNIHETAHLIRHQLADLMRSDPATQRQRIANLAHEDSIWDIAHPVNHLNGSDAFLDQFLAPLCASLHSVRRRDDIFISGENRRTTGGYWLASTGHYVGNFSADLFGIPACERLVFLRSGEFYRIARGKIAEAKIIVDFPDLMRQAGCSRLPHDLGTEMLFPAPASHDGILPNRPREGQTSLDRVEAMFDDLHSFDPGTFSSHQQTGEDGHWHDDMLWYGPGGIGSNYRWSGFVKDHRRSFLEAFPDRVGGHHYCRIGDGAYAAASGWPSMTMTHKGSYLGVAATGRQLTLRVMDFYRCHRGKILENWVFLDYGDLLRQMGSDLFAENDEST